FPHFRVVLEAADRDDATGKEVTTAIAAKNRIGDADFVRIGITQVRRGLDHCGLLCSNACMVADRAGAHQRASVASWRTVEGSAQNLASDFIGAAIIAKYALS